MSSEATSKELILEGEVMRLAIDAATGAFTSIRNKAAHLELLSRLPRKRHVPWIVGFIAAAGGKSDEHQMDNCRDFERLDIEPLAEPKGFLLLWKTTQGPTVQMRVLLREADSGLPERLEFWASADNPTMRVLQTLNAPYINGIGPLGSDQEAVLNRLAHSAHSGFLVDDPVGLMERPFAPGEEPFRFWPMRYPNGFHAPMQFFAYYADGRGGFYFAAHDPHHTAKRIDFQREPNGDIVISTPNYQWNERPGEPMQLEYPYVIAPLVRGDWYEATELYRRWATGSGRDNPTWAHRGRAEDRAKRGDWAAWLSEGVAVCTFGLPASYDVSPWLRAIDAAAGGPVFHVFGHDWPAHARVFVDTPEHQALVRKVDQLWEQWAKGDCTKSWEFIRASGRLSEDDWRDESKVREMLAEVNCGSSDEDAVMARALRNAQQALDLFRGKYDTGKTGSEVENYFPTRLRPENQESLEANGDPAAPFHFDLFPEGLDLEMLGLLSREKARKVDKDTARIVHPASEFYRDFHARRSAAIAGRGGFGALYYDISACTASHYSDRDDFGIPPGAGRQLIEAYRQLYKETRQAAREATGRYIPQGTEVMVENFLDIIDYGQWRVGGGLHGDMEGEDLLPFVKAGLARRIPMWTYVYHEFGGVRLDGWAKLSKSFGELFFYTAAQVALEGQILEINYEFSPLERFPDIDRPSPQLVYLNQISLTDDAPEVDPAKLAWLGEATAARTGFAKDYLAWGRMVPPAKISGNACDIELDYWHYNDIHGHERRGRIRVPSVVHTAWAYRDERVGLLFVNILADREQTVDVAFYLERAGLNIPPTQARRVTDDGPSRLGARFANGEAGLSVTLPPRKIVLVELTP